MFFYLISRQRKWAGIIGNLLKYAAVWRASSNQSHLPKIALLSIKNIKHCQTIQITRFYSRGYKYCYFRMQIAFHRRKHPSANSPSIIPKLGVVS